MAGRKRPAAATAEAGWKMYVIPCSCGTSFTVSPHYDRRGTDWSRYLKCPSCGKRHDPRNRLLQLGYQREKFWQVDEC